MPVELTTPNNAFRYPTSGNNGANFGLGIADLATDADAMWSSGTLAARPPASKLNRVYYATDLGVFYKDTGSAWVGLSTFGAGVTGAVSIAGSQSTSSTSYTTLASPDQVAGIVLPTNGLIGVWYQAMWAESVAGAARAAIFIGANQLKVQAGTGTSGPNTQAAATHSPAPNLTVPLFTLPVGLASAGNDNGGVNFAADVTTGQAAGFAVGNFPYVTDIAWELGGSLVYQTSNNSPSPVLTGGPCYIDNLPAGTYTISVQFKTSSGTVTANNRRLRVSALSF